MSDDDMLPAYMRDNGSHTLTCTLCHAIGYVSVRVGAIDDVGDAVSVVGAAVGASVKEYE